MFVYTCMNKNVNFYFTKQLQQQKRNENEIKRTDRIVWYIEDYQRQMVILEKKQTIKQTNKFGWNGMWCKNKQKPHTSRPILPLSEILIGFEWFVACISVVKWLMPISSSDDLRRPTDTPTLGKPWRSELERLSRISLSI